MSTGVDRAFRRNRLNLCSGIDRNCYGVGPIIFYCQLPPGRVTLSLFSHLQLAYSAYFSKPQSDRLIYRAIRRHKIRKIVELGVGDGRRARRMIQTARLASPGQEIGYVGMDLFEGRSESDGPGLSLKAAYQLLRGVGARVQLVPGNPSESLARTANSLGKIDLLIVPAELDAPSSSRAWFFVPRMLHEQSLVCVEQAADDGQKALHIKPAAEIEQLAAAHSRRRAA
jgi:hypothetical protein